jgi:hypothetical protein
MMASTNRFGRLPGVASKAEHAPYIEALTLMQFLQAL